MKNTQIYPVIKIGDDYFSTNNTTFEGNYCKPILLNIPSIKQSVDIESRKFKISNVSLDLSNFPVSGERFSDRLSTSSLINTEVIVYFVHHDTSEEVYRGQIRRISHDDEKVKVELEDLTEQKAHKPLPPTAPPSNYLPDKYANKPIPMVYGHVDRSPLLPYYSYSEDIGNDSDEVESILEYRLKIDTEQYYEIVEETVNIGNAPFMKSGLFIKEADAYLNLHKTNAELGTFEGVENFRYEGTSIVLDTDDVSYSEDESETSSNDFSKGRLRVHQIRRFNKVSWEETGVEVQGGLIQGELQATSAGIGRITGTTDTATWQIGASIGTNDSATMDWNAGHFKCILEPISIPNSMAKNEDGDIEPPITRVLVDVEHFSFRSEETTPSGQDVNTSSGHFNQNGSILFTKWGVWVGGVPTDYTQFGGQSASTSFTSANSLDNINGSDSISEILLDGFTTLTSYDNIKIGIPKHLFPVYNYTGTTTTFDDDDDVVFNVDTTINDAFVVQTFFLDGITDKDYFVNVKGRVNTFNDHPEPPENNFIENPIDIIYDILRSELGLTADQINEDDYAEARKEHEDWEFGFTINKKTDSKKLIEDIAKSTKCFPKFKNDGTFGFNIIKDTYTVSNNYGTGDYETATEIKEQDVINYSFSKTKPEQIYKKVDVQYEKDYAQDSYLKRTESEYTGINTGEFDDVGNPIWTDEYYGIENSKDAYLEFESDYIRKDDTANRLNKFLSEQYRNDHLIFNLKLPLSYNKLEVGDLVKFRSLLNGIKAYGIDYRLIQDIGTIDEAAGYEQRAFPLFMVTSTKKNLDSIEIECMQLHYLKTAFTIVSSDWYDGVLNEQGNFIEGDETGLFYFPDSSFASAIQEETVEEEVIEPTGDANSDGHVNILDIVAIVNFIFGNQQLTEYGTTEADFNGDGSIDIIDIVGIVNKILEDG